MSKLDLPDRYRHRVVRRTTTGVYDREQMIAASHLNTEALSSRGAGIHHNRAVARGYFDCHHLSGSTIYQVFQVAFRSDVTADSG
jgi:hypothetical protein